MTKPVPPLSAHGSLANKTKAAKAIAGAEWTVLACPLSDSHAFPQLGSRCSAQVWLFMVTAKLPWSGVLHLHITLRPDTRRRLD
jgi:hypothetical protein